MSGLDNNNKFSSIFFKESKNKLYIQRDEPDLVALHDEPSQYATRSNPVNVDEVFQKTIELRTGFLKHFPAINVNDLDEATRCLARHQGLEETIQQNAKELKNIEGGLYQEQLYLFTYDLSQDSESGSRLPVKPIQESIEISQEIVTYIVYPLMDQPGLKCTAAISKQVSSGPIEIQINFFGTIDFASLLADMERGGPGQQTLKIHEAKLLQQVNSLIESMSAIYPNKTFRLRLAGHSLGGALAKGFAHSMQRACALQENTPETIVMKIKKELEKEKSIENTVPDGVLRSFQEKLNVDKDKFRELNALSKVEGMTIYALGVPGLSKTTDRHASLFTYYHQADFLNVYNHYHREDIIPKFGDTEFFSGKNGVIPRVIVNKAVQYDAKLSEGEVKEATPLPFPGITKRVMAAHNKRIYTGDRSVQSTVVELTESKYVLEKFSFSVFRRVLYEIIFFLAKILALFMSKTKWIYTLESYPARDVEAPKNIINLSARYLPKARFRPTLFQVTFPVLGKIRLAL